jgi:hypothetical protein
MAFVLLDFDHVTLDPGQAGHAADRGDWAN